MQFCTATNRLWEQPVLFSEPVTETATAYGWECPRCGDRSFECSRLTLREVESFPCVQKMAQHFVDEADIFGDQS